MNFGDYGVNQALSPSVDGKSCYRLLPEVRTVSSSLRCKSALTIRGFKIGLKIQFDIF